MFGLADILAKKIRIFDKFFELPLKLQKIFETDSRIEYNFEVKSVYILQMLRKIINFLIKILKISKILKFFSRLLREYFGLSLPPFRAKRLQIQDFEEF